MAVRQTEQGVLSGNALRLWRRPVARQLPGRDALRAGTLAVGDGIIADMQDLVGRDFQRSQGMDE